MEHHSKAAAPEKAENGMEDKTFQLRDVLRGRASRERRWQRTN